MKETQEGEHDGDATKIPPVRRLGSAITFDVNPRPHRKDSYAIRAALEVAAMVMAEITHIETILSSVVRGYPNSFGIVTNYLHSEKMIILAKTQGRARAEKNPCREKLDDVLEHPLTANAVQFLLHHCHCLGRWLKTKTEDDSFKA